MFIKEMLSMNRRDFYAIYECEHCHHTEKKSGYDDSYFHAKVIPAMECTQCGKRGGEDYQPLATRYHDNVII